MTMTSHLRPPHHPGAESGLFLARIHELLLGEDDFYERIFRDLGVPYEPVQLGPTSSPLEPRGARR